jgi:hypothetical protein
MAPVLSCLSCARGKPLALAKKFEESGPAIAIGLAASNIADDNTRVRTRC